MNIKELLEDRKKIMDEVESINTKLKEKKELMQQLEKEIHKRMADEGIEKTGAHGLTVWIKQEIIPKVSDWTEVYSYIEEHKLYSLLHKRINSNAFKELVDNGEIPRGMQVESYEKLAFRKG
jgi:hypothetical protein